MENLKKYIIVVSVVILFSLLLTASYTPSGITESTNNNTTTPLNASDTYTGTYEICKRSTVAIYVLTDQDAMLYVDFSKDGTNTDATLTFSITASVNEVHNIKALRPYYRIRITNTSTSNETYLRAGVRMGDFGMSVSPLNAVIQQDADANVVRSIDSEIDIAAGRYTGLSIVNKFGRNPDVDAGSTPEDVWNGGGTYAGFPTGSTEQFQVFSSSASANNLDVICGYDILLVKN